MKDEERYIPVEGRKDGIKITTNAPKYFVNYVESIRNIIITSTIIGNSEKVNRHAKDKIKKAVRAKVVKNDFVYVNEIINSDYYMFLARLYSHMTFKVGDLIVVIYTNN